MKIRFLLILVLFASLYISCTSDLDFDQADHLEISPVFEGDLFYFDLYKPNMTDYNGEFRNEITDTMKVDVFEDVKIRDAFSKIEIEIAYENTFERNFDTRLIFADEYNREIVSAYLNINPATENNPTVTGDSIYVFDKQTYPDFVELRKIILLVTITPNTLPIEDKHLHFKSKATVYIQTTIE